MIEEYVLTVDFTEKFTESCKLSSPIPFLLKFVSVEFSSTTWNGLKLFQKHLQTSPNFLFREKGLDDPNVVQRYF